MTPLEPLAASSSIARLLRGGTPAEVQAELERLEVDRPGPHAQAAILFARGALALRLGALEEARDRLHGAARAFDALAEGEAASLCECERWLAALRLGPRSAVPRAGEALRALAAHPAATQRVKVVASHYAGVAARVFGDAEGCLFALTEALSRSDGLLEERAQVLNSLGTLYVVLGATGAATELLEHAAELHHRLGDLVGEAIAFGQLGAAALARGDLEGARRCLQRQEWLSSRTLDPLGRSRALALLADVALQAGRADDALFLATEAAEVADAQSPPLAAGAHARRAIGRARLELGERGAEDDLQGALSRLVRDGDRLGAALCRWDLARLGAARGDSALDGEWFGAAWELGSLGLTARVARLLAERAERGDLEGARALEVEHARAVTARAYPEVGAQHELELLYAAPAALAALAARRVSAERNLGRLAAMVLAPDGLWVAALRSPAADAAGLLPPREARAAVAVLLGACALWVWPGAAPGPHVAEDLARLGATSSGLAVSVDRSAGARVRTPPHPGEPGAELVGVDALELFARVVKRATGVLEIGADAADALDEAARETLRDAGFTVTLAG